MQKIIISLLLVLGNLSLANPVVSRAKGNKAILFTDNLKVEIGDHFYAVDTNENKIGLLEVTKIKGNKALANIILGQAEPSNMPIVKVENDTIITTQDYKNLGLDDDSHG